MIMNLMIIGVMVVAIVIGGISIKIDEILSEKKRETREIW